MGRGRRNGHVLTGDVAVLSPHLDDGVFSLGAAISRAVRGGSSVRIVTVFAGEPESSAEAAWWDHRAGFRTEGEAARARREEDRVACGRLGGTPVWLPFSDATYERAVDDDVLWRAVARSVEDAGVVLVPGFPLLHVDHLRLARVLLERRLPVERTGLYVEQPYAKWQGKRQLRHRPSVPPAIADLVAGSVAWTSLASDPRARRAKHAAALAYRSQLPLFGRVKTAALGRLLLRRVALYEALRGGEAVAWL